MKMKMKIKTNKSCNNRGRIKARGASEVVAEYYSSIFSILQVLLKLGLNQECERGA